MRRTTKVWLIIAASLVLIGCVLFAGVMSLLEWDFTKLSTVSYETNTYEISEAFDGISINTDTADIAFAFSDNGKCTVECHEEEDEKHSVSVKDGTLIIALNDERSVHNHIGLNFDSPKITICLPQTEYTTLLIREDTGDVEMPKTFIFKNVDITVSTGDVDFCASASEKVIIKTSTGDICVKDVSAGILELSVSTGKAILSDIVCQSVISSGSTGDIFFNNVIAAELFSIERSTGDVKFEGSDAAEIVVKTNTGDVAGSLLSEKVFVTQTNTGDVDVPPSTSGGICTVTTSTGDIKLDIP